MPPLAAIERFFERLFERPSARFFRTHVQPIQIQRRIERAMESGRRAGGARTQVPNRYVVHLHPDELAGLAEVADELASGLADEALAFARTHHYALADRPHVDLVADPSVQRADIRVDARFASTPQAPPSGDDAGPATGPGGGAAGPADPTATTVFTVPQGTAPSASLHVTDPDGHTRRSPSASAGSRSAAPTTTAWSRATSRYRVTTAGSSGAAGRSSTRTSAARTGPGSTESWSVRSCSGSVTGS